MWSALDLEAGDEDLYKILGCTENSSEEQISAEYKVRALKYHPDKNPGDESALVQFQKLQEAVNILLDSTQRIDYDKWRHSQVAIPYKQWKAMNSRFQMTMHWAKPREQTMIEDGERDAEGTLGSKSRSEVATQQGSQEQKKNKSDWKSEEADVYKGFRNYAL